MKVSTTLLTAAALALAGASAIRAQTEPAPTDAAPKKFVEAAAPVGLGGAASTKSKIICKRDVEIGSLVKGIRRCGTADEWRRSSEAARKATSDIQDQKSVYTAP